jgi:HAD superfamily hydrolase (TIGR01509 family)
VRAAIFDWDGTLADSHSSLFEANAAVMRALDLPFSPELYRQHYAPDWRLMYERLGVPADRVDEANRIWEAAFHGTATSTLLPGAIQAVERLVRAGVPMALVTAGPRAIVEPQMRRLGLWDRIGVRVFGDEQPEQKPHPAPLLRALKELGLDDRPSEAVYLGDAPDDMRMAVAAGVQPIGVLSMLSDEQLLRLGGAETVVGSVAEWVDALLDGAPRPGETTGSRGTRQHATPPTHPAPPVRTP